MALSACSPLLKTTILLPTCVRSVLSTQDHVVLLFLNSLYKISSFTHVRVINVKYRHPVFFVQSSVDRHIGCFNVLDIVKSFHN